MFESCTRDVRVDSRWVAATWTHTPCMVV